MKNILPYSPIAKLTSLSLSLIVLAFPHIARGTSQDWTGGSLSNGNWATSANWHLDTTPPASNQRATFNAAIANTWGESAANPIELGTGRTIRYITVTGTSGSYFIGASDGNALTMASSAGDGGLWLMDNFLENSPTFTINAPVVLAEVTTAAHHRWKNDSASGTFVINGNVTTAAASGTTTLLLQGTNTTANTIAGNISDNGDGVLGITKNFSNGTWILSGVNSYSGPTAITHGTLLVNGTHNGGSTNGYTVSASGILGGSGTITTSSVTMAAGTKLTPGGTGTTGNLSFTLASESASMYLAASSNGSGAYLFDLGSTSSSDKIVLTLGTLNIGAMSNADFVFTEAPGFGTGTYILFDASSAITGSITSLPDSIIFSGGLTGTLSIDEINHDILLTVVPEPGAGAMALMAMGVFIILRCARRCGVRHS